MSVLEDASNLVMGHTPAAICDALSLAADIAKCHMV